MPSPRADLPAYPSTPEPRDSRKLPPSRKSQVIPRRHPDGSLPWRRQELEGSKTALVAPEEIALGPHSGLLGPGWLLAPDLRRAKHPSRGWRSTPSREFTHPEHQACSCRANLLSR